MDVNFDGKILLVASTGGHLTQLFRLSHNFFESNLKHWVTFKTDQSEKLLAEQESVHYIPYIQPRGFFSIFKQIPKSILLMLQIKPDYVISTGAGTALAFLPFAPLLGIKSIYIESFSRVKSPSLTGKILSNVPWVECKSQHRYSNTKKWDYLQPNLGDLLISDYSPQAHKISPGVQPKCFVSLGTIRPYRFDRLIDQVLLEIAPYCEMYWQIGETYREDLPGHYEQYYSSDSFRKLLRESDLIILSAGVGAAIEAVEQGKFPILIPRSKQFNEHVDDHQKQISESLEKLGLARQLDVEDLTWENIISI